MEYITSKQHIDDGRKTMKQEIEHLRANNPDHLAPYGEWTDNSVDWGNATKGAMVISEGRSVIIDNGKFDINIFPKTFCMRKNGTEEQYTTENDWNKLGRFNAGATESALLLGSRAICMHNFTGKIMKTTLEVERCKRDNNITANKTLCILEEIEDFQEYQRLINPDYNISDDYYGTVLIIEGLKTPNTNAIFNNIKQFMYGLYSPMRTTQITWQMFNWISDSWPIHTPNPQPTYTIEPNNLSFDSIPITETMYVYISSDDPNKKVYKQSPIPNTSLLYSFKIETKFFNLNQRTKEKEIYGNTTDEQRVGFQVRRAGRLVSGITPLRWELPTGMNRAQGLRIMIEIPAGIEPDNDWCIGTFKKITNDTWGHFNPELKSFITELFKNTNAMHDKSIKLKQNKFINIYNKKSNEIDNDWDEETIITKIMLADEELFSQLETKDVIKKKSGKAYNTIINYIENLKKLKNYAPTSDTELSDNSIEAYLLQQEVELQQNEEITSKLNIVLANQQAANPIIPLENSNDQLDREDIEKELTQSQLELTAENINIAIPRSPKPLVDINQSPIPNLITTNDMDTTILENNTKFMEWELNLSSIELRKIHFAYYNAQHK